MSDPFRWYPAKVKTWEWSAVTMMRVSSSFVMFTAVSTLRENSKVSIMALLVREAWWAMSILPPGGKGRSVRTQSSSDGEEDDNLMYQALGLEVRETIPRIHNEVI